MQAIRNEVDFKVLAVDRIANGFGEDIKAEEISKYLFHHGVQNIFFQNSDECVNWANSFGPDFIFTSTPYDLYLPNFLKSENLRKIGKICYLNYGFPMSKSNLVWAKSNPFLENIAVQFDPNESKDSGNYVVPIGSVKLELESTDTNILRKQVQARNLPQSQKIIGWRPRWTLDKDSTFWLFFESLTNWAQETNTILYFFVHPLFRKKLLNAGYQGSNALKKLEVLESKGVLVSIVEDEYVSFLSEVQVLIGDLGSGLPEAAHFGVPIIFTGDKEDLNTAGKDLMNDGYITESPRELIYLLNQAFVHPINIELKHPRSPFFQNRKGHPPSMYLFKVLKDLKSAYNLALIGGTVCFDLKYRPRKFFDKFHLSSKNLNRKFKAENY